jgi:PhnB protein
MKLSPRISLSFNGQCEAAFKFYERHLGAKTQFVLRWRDSPMADQAPPDWGDKILHGRIRVGDSEVVGDDAVPQQYERPNGFAILLTMDDPAEAERIFNGLAENGKVQMPIQKTFWALRFGVVADQFGIPWAINCEEVQ